MSGGFFSPRAVNQYTAHRFRRRAEEVCPIFPGLVCRSNQAEPGLMYQGCWLKRVTRGFMRHFLRREFAQLFVYERQ